MKEKITDFSQNKRSKLCHIQHTIPPLINNQCDVINFYFSTPLFDILRKFDINIIK